MHKNNYTSNFKFLESDFSILANIGTSAEFYSISDPPVSLGKSRLFGEKLTELLFQFHGLIFPEKNDFSIRLKTLKQNEILPQTIINLLYVIKDTGNKAIHSGNGTADDSFTVLSCLFKLAIWFQNLHGKSKIDNKSLNFITPQVHNIESEFELLDKEYKKLEVEFKKLLDVQQKTEKKLSDIESKKLKEKAIKLALNIELDEKETRIIIDKQLKDAGWDVDTQNINFKKNKNLPEKGKNIAIAEWKVGNDYADYALFIGLEFYGIIEAKRKSKDVISDVSQAKIYSKKASDINNAVLLGKWDVYNVPFMFSTNGRPYHPQLEIKSGMWFLDGRKSTNHPKSLRGWFSPEDLKNLFAKNTKQASISLKNETFDYLTDPNELGLRYYQVDAIEAVEKKIAASENKKNRALIAMATGTGKTRTIIGLCYRLIKSKSFNRILFLVDRNVLGRQAVDSFNDVPIEDLQTFSKIYDIKDLKDKKPDIDTKIHFATVQGMFHRIYLNESEPLSVGAYDCIIVDEAHRGYILDRAIDEDKIEYKDQDDFMSKYKMVIDYFDAFVIGLTATPALHTNEIFGDPVYRYTYRQAVIDDFLVDHEPPYVILTERNQKGIKWKKGERPFVYDRKVQDIKKLDKLKDDLDFEVDVFNKKVITEPFNRAVLSEIVKYINPLSEKKTLIFAATDEHADLVVDILKDEFVKAEIEIEDDAIKKITGSLQKPTPQEMVNLFKNEKNPNIVVTVDLLSTGVDVPKICNIVFLRKIKSRILYDQMLGRATRKCDEIGKDYFEIFDAVGVYADLEKFTDMQPVVSSVKTTMEELALETEKIKTNEAKIKHLADITSKLNRKKKRIKGNNLEKFKKLSGGVSPEIFIKNLRNTKPHQISEKIKAHLDLFRFLDGMESLPVYQFISNHEDEVHEVQRGYGKGVKPEDYIEGFKNFIKENRNKISALNIVCTKPAELTRTTLKELIFTLDEAGFSVIKLNTAWKETKNEDIAADIISFIRTMALGNALISHEERIKKAFQKIRGKQKWTAQQLTWLDRFEKQLLKENVLSREDLDILPFKADGGYDRINKIFNNDLDKVLELINKNLYIHTA